MEACAFFWKLLAQRFSARGERAATLRLCPLTRSDLEIIWKRVEAGEVSFRPAFSLGRHRHRGRRPVSTAPDLEVIWKLLCVLFRASGMTVARGAKWLNLWPGLVRQPGIRKESGSKQPS